MLWFSWHFKYLDLGRIFWLSPLQGKEVEKKTKTKTKIPSRGWLKEKILVHLQAVAHFIDATIWQWLSSSAGIYSYGLWLNHLFYLVNAYWAYTTCQTLDTMLSMRGPAIKHIIGIFKQWNKHAISRKREKSLLSQDSRKLYLYKLP